ncbi:MAG: peptidylprolyl isomerase [Lachnospiraceae bacterium]|nr:peptidylprolyl isomerase [Lachnospiraceae bacterium]
MRKKIYGILAGTVLMAACLAGCNSAKPDAQKLPEQGSVVSSASEKQADGQNVQKRAEELAGQKVLTFGDFSLTMDQMMFWLYSEEKEAAQYDYMYQMYYGTSYMDLTHPQAGISMREFHKEYVLNSAKQYAILYQEALKNGITLSEEEIAENEAFVNSFFELLSVSELEKGGFTREVLRQVADIMTYAEKYYNFMIEKFSIQEEDVISSVNKEEYKEYETEYLFLSTVSYDENSKLVERTAEEKAEDYAYMEGLLEKLKGGSTMAELQAAETESVLTYTGKTFLANTADVEPAYVEAAAKLVNGEYSGIVETKYGYYIIRMVNDSCTTSYEAALDEAYGAMVDELFAKEYAKLEETYAPVVNEEVWNAVTFGNYVIDAEK